MVRVNLELFLADLEAKPAALRELARALDDDDPYGGLPGGDVPGAAGSIRYRGDDDPDVARLTETLVAEVVAATWCAR
jgi:hypothetical protein